MIASSGRRLLPALMLLSLAPGLAGCPGPDPDPQPAPMDAGVSLLPTDYQARYPVVRDCRRSVEHDLNNIVIRAEASLTERYEHGPYPLPVGMVLVKEEFSDPACSALVGWTLMRKEAEGYDPRFADWSWQRLAADGKVLEDGKIARCAGCHAAPACRARDFACAEP